MDFLVPKLSATMESAKVLRWLKQAGDAIAAGEPLVELETDKAAMEVESPVDATLEQVLAAEGAELPIGGVLARLKTEGDAATQQPRRSGEAAPAAPPTASVRPGAATPSPRILASPFARRLARMNGVALGDIAGAGPRLRGRDVLATVAARDAKGKAAPLPARFEPLSPLRRRIAEEVTLSRRTIPSFVMDRWVETTALDRAGVELGPKIAQAIGVAPTFTDFLLQALAESLAAHPRLLHRWHEEDGRVGQVRAPTIDIGLVVALSDGVMIPTLRDLGGKSLKAITQARAAAVQRARAGRMAPSDSAPAAFSLSNTGRSGPDRFEAIINPGQSGILAVGRQHERVIARSGEIAIVVGVNLTLSVDHRLIDGLHGAEFLQTLAERLERGGQSSAEGA